MRLPQLLALFSVMRLVAIVTQTVTVATAAIVSNLDNSAVTTTSSSLRSISTCPQKCLSLTDCCRAPSDGNPYSTAALSNNASYTVESPRGSSTQVKTLQPTCENLCLSQASPTTSHTHYNTSAASEAVNATSSTQKTPTMMTTVGTSERSQASSQSTETTTSSGAFNVSSLSMSGSAARASASAIGNNLEMGGAAARAGVVAGFVVMGLAL